MITIGATFILQNFLVDVFVIGVVVDDVVDVVVAAAFVVVVVVVIVGLLTFIL